MRGADPEVLAAARDWLAAGHRVVLATLVRTLGSAPRPVGALLALSDRGLLSGSVSGGCVEADLLERVRADFPDRPGVMAYGVEADTARRFGLPCGGTLELVLEPLASTAVVDPLLDALARRRCLRRTLDLATGRVELAEGDLPEDCAFDGRRLDRVYGPRWRLLAIGAGQITRFLAEMAQALDYDVLVCEPREEYRASWQGHGELLPGMPDDAVRDLAPDGRSVVVALTHDPRLDDLALMEALGSRAFYVGALGSRRNQARRRERLAELGLGTDQVARLHGPVGLPLGGRTPAEIALAILAEVTALRHGAILTLATPAPRAEAACA
ncbi:MAG: XdhC family protein [Thiobacillaceae bacterium]|jgi:xanthine dehydrogenase accessory factor|nr:XdhC family protein [Thiobacillaceae bacterium]